MPRRSLRRGAVRVRPRLGPDAARRVAGEFRPGFLRFAPFTKCSPFTKDFGAARVPWWPCPVAVVAVGVEGGSRDRPPSAGHWPHFRDHRHRLVCVGIVAGLPNRRVRRGAAQEVALLWGGPHVQVAPEAWVGRPPRRSKRSSKRTRPDATSPGRFANPGWRGRGAAHQTGPMTPRPGATPEGTSLVRHLCRRVSGTYVFQNPDSEPRNIRVKFPFPASTQSTTTSPSRSNGVATPRGGDLQGSRNLAVSRRTPRSGWTCPIGRVASTIGGTPWRQRHGRRPRLPSTVITNVRDVDFPPGRCRRPRGRRGERMGLTWRSQPGDRAGHWRRFAGRARIRGRWPPASRSLRRCRCCSSWP